MGEQPPATAGLDDAAKLRGIIPEQIRKTLSEPSACRSPVRSLKRTDGACRLGRRSCATVSLMELLARPRRSLNILCHVGWWSSEECSPSLAEAYTVVKSSNPAARDRCPSSIKRISISTTLPRS